MNQGRRNRRNERGFSLLELMIVVAIMLIIAAIAIPSLLKARVAAHEASAAQTTRTLLTAEANFKTLSEGYAPDFLPLKTANILDPSWQDASPSKRSGYNYSLALVAATGGFTITAEPVTQSDGHRAFCTNEKGVIFFDGGVDPATGNVTTGTGLNCLTSLALPDKTKVLGVNN